MLPISPSATIRVEQFLQFELDDEQRERMGAYFLWLEEKSMLMWDTPSVYLAYQHCLMEEEQLHTFLAFYSSLEEATGAMHGLYGVLTAYLAHSGRRDIVRRLNGDTTEEIDIEG